jgi:hypothetical protein
MISTNAKRSDNLIYILIQMEKSWVNILNQSAIRKQKFDSIKEFIPNISQYQNQLLQNTSTTSPSQMDDPKKDGSPLLQ